MWYEFINSLLILPYFCWSWTREFTSMIHGNVHLIYCETPWAEIQKISHLSVFFLPFRWVCTHRCDIRHHTPNTSRSEINALQKKKKKWNDNQKHSIWIMQKLFYYYFQSRKWNIHFSGLEKLQIQNRSVWCWFFFFKFCLCVCLFIFHCFPHIESEWNSETHCDPDVVIIVDCGASQSIKNSYPFTKSMQLNQRNSS